MPANRTSFYPGQPWPDNHGVHINAHGGGILCHNGIYYWFGEHKVETELGNTAQVGVSCYSSADLYNWKDEGIALPVSEEPGHDIEKGCILERPKVIYNKRTGKFVMWFHLELKGKGYDSAMCATAVSDSPTGPYRYIEAFRPNAAVWPVNVEEENKIAGDRNTFLRDFEGGQMSRDMTLFVDTDGKAYHICSSEDNKTTHISLLSDDTLKPSGTYARAFKRRYMEAAAICKRKGKYHFIASDCSGWDPNTARSGLANSIFGPWEEIGNPCVGKNPHNGLDHNKTFGGQSTFILKVEGKDDAYIAMFDVWTPKNPIDGGYIWLPVQFKDDGMKIVWMDEWDLSFFDS